MHHQRALRDFDRDLNLRESKLYYEPIPDRDSCPAPGNIATLQICSDTFVHALHQRLAAEDNRRHSHGSLWRHRLRSLAADVYRLRCGG